MSKRPHLGVVEVFLRNGLTQETFVKEFHLNEDVPMTGAGSREITVLKPSRAASSNAKGSLTKDRHILTT